MKQLLLKIPAIIGMLIGLISLYAFVEYHITGFGETWVISSIFAMFSMPFFFIDAIISLVKAIKKDDSKFNYILAAVLLIAIPMVIFVGADGRDHINIFWNIYYLLVFVLEFISIKKAIASMKANKK